MLPIRITFVQPKLVEQMALIQLEAWREQQKRRDGSTEFLRASLKPKVAIAVLGTVVRACVRERWRTVHLHVSCGSCLAPVKEVHKTAIAKALRVRMPAERWEEC